MFRSLIASIGQGVAAWLAAPTAANLALIITDKTGTGSLVFNTSPRFVTDIAPLTNDGASLGTSALQWSDLFLAEGGVINWDNGDVTITQTNNVLSFAGATTRYEFDAPLTPSTTDGAALGTASLMWSDAFLASGAVINFNNGNYTITHAAGLLTFSGALTVTGATTLSSALTYGGVTLSNSVAGTGSMVLSASPTFTGTVTIPTLVLTTVGAHTISGAITYGGVTLSNSVSGTGSMALTAGTTFTGTTTIATLSLTTVGAHTISGAITYGGVTLSNAVTGTGNMVLSASPTLTGTLTAATANLSGKLTASGGVAVAVIRPAQITSNQNNYAPTGLATCGVLEVQSDAARDITGLSATGITDGQIISINNVGSFTITLKNLSGSSSGANQFVCPGLVDYPLTLNSAIVFYYTSGIWRVFR